MRSIDTLVTAGRLPAELRPRLHQPAALVEQVAAAVGGLNRIRDRVRECSLANLARERRALAGPIAERRTEAMSREVGTAQLGDACRLVFGDRLARRSGKDVVAPPDLPHGLEYRQHRR